MREGDFIKLNIIVMSYPICFINSAGGRIMVQLKVNNALLAGGGFIVFEVGKPNIDKWEMEIKPNGKDEHTIDTAIDILDGKIIKWIINVCSLSQNITKGIAEIKIFQDNKNCLTTEPLYWEESKIPLCSTAKPWKIKGGLIFNLKS